MTKIHAARAARKSAKRAERAARAYAARCWAEYETAVQDHAATVVEDSLDYWTGWSRVGEYGRQFPPRRTSEDAVKTAAAKAVAAITAAGAAADAVVAAEAALADLYAAHSAGRGTR